MPTLRQLGDLPREEASDSQSFGESSWGTRQGIFTLGLLASLLLAGGAGYFFATQPKPLPPFDLEARSASLDIGIDRLTPVQIWTMWKTDYEPLAKNGFRKIESPANKYVTEKIAKHELYRNILGIAAGATLALAMLLYLALPK